MLEGEMIINAYIHRIKFTTSLNLEYPPINNTGHVLSPHLFRIFYKEFMVILTQERSSLSWIKGGVVRKLMPVSVFICGSYLPWWFCGSFLPCRTGTGGATLALAQRKGLWTWFSHITCIHTSFRLQINNMKTNNPLVFKNNEEGGRKYSEQL